MRIEFIINTADGGALAELREEVQRLRDEGHFVQARVTFEPGDASRFAREATVEGADLVIAAGGDGTLNEVLNGVLGPGADSAQDAPPRIAVIPLGTANDFAAFLGVPDEIATAVRLAVEGPETLIDVGSVNGRLFLNVSSGGLGAEATEEASDRSKRLLGSIAYLITGIRKFATLDPLVGRFSSNGEIIFDGPFLFFAVGNGGRTGGGVWITPRADITDGLLDVCIAGEVDHREFLRMLPDLRTGEHVGNENVTYRQVRELRVDPVGDLSVNVDGEPIGGSVLNYSVRPRALRVAGTPAGRLEESGRTA